MPFSSRYFECPVDARKNEDKYSWGFSLDSRYVEEFDVKYTKPVEHFESQLCIHSAFKSSGKNAFSPKHMDFMFKYAKTEGLTPVGKAFGNLVCSVVDNGKLTGFFEAWLPVEK